MLCEVVAMTIAETKTITPSDLLAMPDAVDYELVDGQLVQRHTGSEASAVALAIDSLLRAFVKAHHLGHLFTTDCGYQCFPDSPGKVRKPDVSFVRTGRLPDERPPKGYIRIAPDLAVEVLSPGDTAEEVEEKAKEYLGAGVRLIWIVSPTTHSVRIIRPANSPLGPSGAASEKDTVSGEDVLPGFTARVAEFFEI
jgi:Uma2 family endonuclease